VSWDPQHLPSEAGRTFVVTGGNAGIGYFTAEQLASTGARVILASRSAEKAERAIASIGERVAGADLDFVTLDLSSLSSVASAATALRAHGPIDGLINNAGLVSPPARRATTSDGHEIVVGSNFFGHFALTAQLWPALTPTGRVVGLGSMATRLVLMADKPGTYVGRSTQYSGGGFSDMRFDAVAMEPAAFEDWVRQTKAQGGTLDAVAYTRLVRPSSAVPPQTFGAVAPKLFETAIHLTVR